MKVFISWSGNQSRALAVVLRDWIPAVLQSVEPYVSSEDIDKGARWSTDIAVELEGSGFGILCVTQENLEAPWLNFEAGALSKQIDRSRVAPFLIGVKHSDVQGPIRQFQGTVAERGDVQKLLRSMNDACEVPLSEQRLESGFDMWWPRLESALQGVEEVAPTSPNATASVESVGPDAILEELLELVRGQHRILNTPQDLLPAGYLRSVMVERGAVGSPLPSNHPALRDIETSWPPIREAVRSFLVAAEDPEAMNLEEATTRMNRAVRYLLTRFGRLPSRQDSLRHASEAALEDDPSGSRIAGPEN